MPLDLDYQRAAEAALAADKAAAGTHAALFDFARELGDLAAQIQARNGTLPVHVRFVRRQPPNLSASTGVHIEEAPKERAPGFASVVLETLDLFFAVESIPGVAVAAATNVPELEAYANAICGIREDTQTKPHLLARTPSGDVGVPPVHTAAGLLEAFLVCAGDVFVARAGFNPPPTA